MCGGGEKKRQNNKWQAFAHRRGQFFVLNILVIDAESDMSVILPCYNWHSVFLEVVGYFLKNIGL